MSRRPFVAGNWKMHKTGAEAAAFVAALRGEIPAGVDVAVCAPFTALADTVPAAAGSGIAVYAQNMHQAESGAFTGEVSAAMLLAAGVDGVLIGHSERRQLFGETDQSVSEKVVRAHAAGLSVILAVGETAAEREADLTEQVLERQVRAGLEALEPDAGRRDHARLRAHLGDRHRPHRDARRSPRPPTRSSAPASTVATASASACASSTAAASSRATRPSSSPSPISTAG